MKNTINDIIMVRLDELKTLLKESRDIVSRTKCKEMKNFYMGKAVAISNEIEFLETTKLLLENEEEEA